MVCFISPGSHFMAGSLAIDWGKFIRYTEIGEDGYAMRQIEVYKIGCILRYDRDHWCDDYGMLIMKKFSRKNPKPRCRSNLSRRRGESFDSS